MLLLPTLLLQTLAQNSNDQCMQKFTKGKENFILDADQSVKDGATFLGSPTVSQVADCVSACCKDANCNLALMENGQDTGSIKVCFIFNCLYKQKKVCRFTAKKGFNNYLLTSVFGSYLEEYVPSVEDKPPKAIPGQDVVVQPRENVTLNGVQSKDDNQIVEYKWTLVSGSSAAVLEKAHFDDQVMVSNLTAGLYKFRLTVKDNAGQSDSADVTVLVLTPEQSRHHCLVPKKEGPCRGSFPRWHYNAASEKCEKFNFGGCKENRNNYVSMDECLKACDKVSVNEMSSGRLGPLDGPKEDCGGTCGPENFNCTNGCCIEKELECDAVKQCSDGSDEEQCAKWGRKFDGLLDLDSTDKGAAAVRCTQPPVTGPCHSASTRWYYNPYNKKCNRFNWGGCDGNENNFENEDNCLQFCNGVNEKDAFAKRASFEKLVNDNDSVAIAVAVALGLAILILLVVIGYCILKGKKKKQQPRHQYVAANGLMPIDDTEKLVYNSTTKPI